MSISVWERKLAPPGDLPIGIITWKGPASYTVVTAGTPPTGGDKIPVSLLGVNRILGVVGAGSYSGNFQVIPIRVSPTLWTLEWRALVTATVGGKSQTTGLEAVSATDLSGELVRLQVTTESA